MGKKELFILLAFFIPLLFIGLSSVDDYGLSWDEYRNRINGYFAYTYLVNGDPALFDYRDRFHGTAFDLPLVLAETFLRLPTFRDIFLLRHYATFLIFYVACIFFYFLSKRLTGSRRLALVAVGMLVISPRIFADAFYNSKDIVFMGMFVVSVYTMIIFMEKQTPARALLHGAACALLVDVRVGGIMVPVFTFVWTAAEALRTSRFLAAIKTTALYLAAFFGLAVLFWPYLWPHPPTNLWKALIQMSHYPEIVDTLYLGRYLPADALPWHYLPVWMMITIPPVYLLFFTTGAIGVTVGLFTHRENRPWEKATLLVLLAWFFGPIILAIAIGSTLYDAWRQFFFIYPAFVLIGVIGLKKTWRIKKLRPLIVICLAVNTTAVLWFMVKHHPHQNVYFNCLAGRDYDAIKQKFDMDYWGVAYRQALEKIVAIDRRPEITIFAANDPGVLNAFMLPESQRQRLWFVRTPAGADYFITNYRWQKKPYRLAHEVFSVDVKGAKIVSVFRLDGSETEEDLPQRFRGVFFDYFDDDRAWIKKRPVGRSSDPEIP